MGVEANLLQVENNFVKNFLVEVSFRVLPYKASLFMPGFGYPGQFLDESWDHGRPLEGLRTLSDIGLGSKVESNVQLKTQHGLDPVRNFALVVTRYVAPIGALSGSFLAMWFFQGLSLMHVN
uniref:Uncharacterized protein n=1 Tax=Cannabis sativa TaxID=3483 RepID=A0A803PJT2_CANSA